MYRNLEEKIARDQELNFKSEGERRIAYFLDANAIKYIYEPGVLVNSSKEKPRIWYPDYYLPEFKTYIEYFGLAGKQSYDRGIKVKESAYSKEGLDVISVYPWMFKENWQGYIMKELKRNTYRRYRNLMSKPYWSNNRSALNKKFTPAWVGYRRGGAGHY